MLSSLVLCVLASISIANADPIAPRAPTLGFPYGSTKVRGVNLGGWLVLEPWITPSLFDNTGDSRVVDEYTFGQFVPRSTAASRLTQHWNSFITEQDFVEIKAAGLNHVRIPIGYWAYDVSAGEPYHQGQHTYLQRAVGWARNHGVKVIIDLHGAPGSQNGFDNSGRRGQTLWHTNANNVARTNAIIKRLAAEFSTQTDVVTAIAPLNEPAGFVGGSMLSTVRQYWFDSYGNIRFPFGTSQEGNLLVMLHDAFQPLSFWNGFQAAPDFQGVAMDTHIYQMFSDEGVARSDNQHVQAACGEASRLAAYTTLWVVVGEWTPAMTDCAKYLNGRGVGARYDGTRSGSPRVGDCGPKTGNSANWTAAYKSFLRRSWEAQVTAFERGGEGWIMWTWKNEVADDWSYQKGLAGGWIPRNPTERQFPNVCP